jgi:16S rRNA (cytosine967-C5)-methyltransferase
MMTQLPPDARHAALDLLQAVLVRARLLDDAFSTDATIKTLEDRDRAFARLLTATTLRRLGQIDDVLRRCIERPLPPKAARVHDVLRLGACQLLFLDTPPHAALSTSVEMLKHSPLAGYAKLANAVLRRLDREGRAWVAEQDAAKLNTPPWLWTSWCNAYGEDTARAIATGHLGEAPCDITVIGDPAAWMGPLEAEMMPTGTLRRPSGGSVTGLPGFGDGAWFVQDMAAALPVALLGDIHGKRVADLCAAPGGKALQMAVAGAHVTAVDRSAVRLGRLVENLTRMRLDVEIVEADATRWEVPAPFDAVLLDAPCSATGTLRRHPDGLWIKKPTDVAKLAGLQGRLLDSAAAMLRPGGTLVYCVCSLEAEEGIAQLEAFLARNPAFVRHPIEASEVGGLTELLTPEGDLRTLPCHLADQGGMDAFFAARLTRSEDVPQ